MEIFKRFPELENRIEKLCQMRCDEILANMLEHDIDYKRLVDKRTEASMALKNAVKGTEANDLFEKYADIICEQETYEQDSLYKQAVHDVLDIIKDLGLL